MKIDYEKPMIEFDEYELDEAIASGCTTIVTLAPYEYDGYAVCSEYVQPLTAYATGAANWNDSVNCNCYYSSGELPMLTS